jgi:hypothetical protein
LAEQLLCGTGRVVWGGHAGTAAFAAAGTLVAGETGMDTLGCLIVGAITAIGGGTARDILLGRFPVFWFTQTSYIWLCIATSVRTIEASCSPLICICQWSGPPRPLNHRRFWQLATFYCDDMLEQAGLLHDSVLFWGDTLGLGAFCVVGAQVCALCAALLGGRGLWLYAQPSMNSQPPSHARTPSLGASERKSE